MLLGGAASLPHQPSSAPAARLAAMSSALPAPAGADGAGGCDLGSSCGSPGTVGLGGPIGQPTDRTNASTVSPTPLTDSDARPTGQPEAAGLTSWLGQLFGGGQPSPGSTATSAPTDGHRGQPAVSGAGEAGHVATDHGGGLFDFLTSLLDRVVGGHESSTPGHAPDGSHHSEHHPDGEHHHDHDGDHDGDQDSDNPTGQQGATGAASTGQPAGTDPQAGAGPNQESLQAALTKLVEALWQLVALLGGGGPTVVPPDGIPAAGSSPPPAAPPTVHPLAPTPQPDTHAGKTTGKTTGTGTGAGTGGGGGGGKPPPPQVVHKSRNTAVDTDGRPLGQTIQHPPPPPTTPPHPPLSCTYYGPLPSRCPDARPGIGGRW
jgi:hypothetical protein